MDRREKTLQEAWIGDAVLALFARLFVLRETGRVDAEHCVRLTSNQFLNAIGEPAEVEAELGRIYAGGGLDAAFAWIDEHLIPLYRKQAAKAVKRQGRS